MNQQIIARYLRNKLKLKKILEKSFKLHKVDKLENNVYYI